MNLGEALAQILPERAKERTRFLDDDEYRLIQVCRRRRKHREAERDMKGSV